MPPLPMARRHAPGRPTVVVSPRPGAPLAVYLRLPVGAAHEPPRHQGLTHLLEHMMFKGTERHPVGQTAARLEAAGGDLNAWTSHDELVLHATVTHASVAEVFDLLADLVDHPLFPEDELERERDVVLEEIAQSLGDPDDLLDQRVDGAMWPHHPYGQPVLGTPDSVSRIPRQALIDHLSFARSHTPTVVVVGPTDLDEVIRIVDERWPQTFRPAPAPAPARPLSSPPPALQETAPTHEHLLQVAWRGPDDPSHPDRAALAVLMGLLGQTAGDRLSEALDRPPRVGFDAWAGHAELVGGSTLTLGCRVLPDRRAEALDRIGHLLCGIQQIVRGRQVTRARDVLITDLHATWETVDGAASLLLHQETLLGDARTLQDWHASVLQVTPEDVSRVARTWLPLPQAIIAYLGPEVTPLRARDRWRVPAPAPSRIPDRVRHRVLHGVPVALRHRDGAFSALSLLSPGGWLDVPHRKAGLATAWAQTLTRGAGAYDVEAFFDALDERSATLEVRDGPSGLRITIEAPSTQLLDLLDLLGDLLVDPHFNAQEWQGVQEELLESARTRTERAPEVLGDLLAAMRYPRHPWRAPAAGTPASLRQIRPATLRRLHDRHFSRGRWGMAIVGPLPEDLLSDALSWIGDLTEGEPWHPPPTPPWRPREALGHAGRETAHIEMWLDIPGRDASPAERALWQVVEGLLDGQAGRLFLEVREARGLVYDIHPSRILHHDHGLLTLHAATRPNQLDDTERAMTQVLHRLADTPPTDAELRRARHLLEGRALRAGQRVSVQATRRVREVVHGEDGSPASLAAHAQQVSASDVQRAVRDALGRGLIVGKTLPLDGS